MAERDRLVAKYAHLLVLHNRCRMVSAHVTRLPGVKVALDVVRSRIATLDEMRLAA